MGKREEIKEILDCWDGDTDWVYYEGERYSVSELESMITNH